MRSAANIRGAAVFALSSVGVLGVPACATVDHRPSTRAAPVPAIAEDIVPCADIEGDPLSLRPHEPLTVLVHGCRSSPGRLTRLRDALTREGQQVACFRYHHRASIEETGQRLRSALRAIEQQVAPSSVMVLGHSQGGLIARTALSQRTPLLRADYRLVSVAAPFNGIAAAMRCGSRPLHAVTLGVTAAICRTIMGKNWSEIHPRAGSVREPPLLDASVRDHLMVITDESSPLAPQDDFVFAMSEQRNDRMVRDLRVSSMVIVAGHAAAVGEGGGSPATLVNALRRAGRLQHRAIAPDPVGEAASTHRRPAAMQTARRLSHPFPSKTSKIDDEQKRSDRTRT